MTIRHMAKALLMLITLAVLLSLTGCNVVGWAGQVLGGDPEKMVNVTAEYRGLDNQTVAVLVDADNATLFQFPNARLEVCAALTQKIAGNVPGVKTIDPVQIVDFQDRNIYWNTATYSNLAKRLGATRLVLVDLTDYRIHEPGNVHQYRGVINANLRVAETDSTHPNDAAYATQVSVAYPPHRREGLPNADPVTLRKATLDLFSLSAGGKFYDHKERAEQ